MENKQLSLIPHINWFVLLSFAISFCFSSILRYFSFKGTGYSIINYIHVPLITLVPIILYGKVHGGLSSARLKLKPLRAKYIIPIIAAAVGVWCLSQLVNSAVALWLTSVGYTLPKQIEALATMPEVVIGFIGVCILPPVCEELFYRGFVMNGYRRLGIRLSIFLSSMLFAMAHYHIAFFTLAFIYGIFTGYIVYSTGSLYAAMLLHGICNGLTFIIFYSKDFLNINLDISFLALSLGILLLPLALSMLKISDGWGVNKAIGKHTAILNLPFILVVVIYVLYNIKVINN